MCVKDSIQGQVCVLVIAIVPVCVCVCESVCAHALTDLPHSNNSICNENEEDDEGLHKSSDRFLALLKHGQNLRETESTHQCANLNENEIYLMLFMALNFFFFPLMLKLNNVF